MPDRPFSDQKMAPCARGFTELMGACWLEVVPMGPEGQGTECPTSTYEFDGRCYKVAVPQDSPVQRGVRPEPTPSEHLRQ